jgi:hypothetical protein
LLRRPSLTQGSSAERMDGLLLLVAEFVTFLRIIWILDGVVATVTSYGLDFREILLQFSTRTIYVFLLQGFRTGSLIHAAAYSAGTLGGLESEHSPHLVPRLRRVKLCFPSTIHPHVMHRLSFTLPKNISTCDHNYVATMKKLKCFVFCQNTVDDNLKTRVS